MKLHIKLSIFLCGMFLFITVLFELLFTNYFLIDLKRQMGERALDVAKTVAVSPDVLHAFYSDNPSSVLQPYSQIVQRQTNAEFVVIGNKEEIRLTHPLSDQIGKKMVGGDNEEVLKGIAVVSESVGSLGPSLRGKAPIFDEQGNVIGIVSVGFLLDDINERLSFYERSWLIVGLLILALGIVTSFFIASQVKNGLHGFEPKQIAQLYSEKQAILNSIREGIIAVNRSGIVTIINETAIHMLHLEQQEMIIGRHIDEIIPNSPLINIAQTGKKQLNIETLLLNQHIIVNHVPVYNQRNILIGAVSTFRSISEVNRLTEELTHTRKYAEGLRAQTHEYSNKLYTISGLIQLESYQEALDLIIQEANITQHLVHFITTKITDPTIAGLLLSKYNQATEKKIELQLCDESLLNDIPPRIKKNELLTIIGNLIDNAIHAVTLNKDDSKEISVFITSLGAEIMIEVMDNGPGIPLEIHEKIFDVGFTTKGTKDNGFGLAIVRHCLNKLGGHIHITSRPRETIFTVIIPKSGKGFD